jgi:hypothetical protein
MILEAVGARRTGGALYSQSEEVSRCHCHDAIVVIPKERPTAFFVSMAYLGNVGFAPTIVHTYKRAIHRTIIAMENIAVRRSLPVHHSGTRYETCRLTCHTVRTVYKETLEMIPSLPITVWLN